MIRVENLSIEDIKNLDVKNLTQEEIKSLQEESLKCYTAEQSIKLIINSIYGAFANEYFHFYNIAIAETVTLQGQEAIKFTEKMIEKYFKEFFHLDKQLHKALNVKPDWKVKPIKNDVWRYTDTDSGYLVFEEVIESVGWEGSVKDFVISINNARLAEYIKKVLDDYAKERNTENYLDFELETINRSALHIQKKHYINNVAWEDGIFYENLSGNIHL
jgi:DNA polymerase elongation subunit (family B)